MNAIEIKGLKKSFRGMYALNGLNMTVPVGSIYGFIGENGSGKSTTEKLICGHLVKDAGTVKLFGKDYTDPGVRVRVGALIENAGCFPGSSIYTNLKMQCLNLGIENVEEEINRRISLNTDDVFSVFMIDADHFKRVNDTYGHNTGDAVLMHVAAILKNYVGDAGEVVRWGGEEFITCLKGSTLEEAVALAELIRSRVEETACEYDGNTIKITMSFGVAVMDSGHSLEENVKDADENLYAAKTGGRNRVVY